MHGTPTLSTSPIHPLNQNVKRAARQARFVLLAYIYRRGGKYRARPCKHHRARSVSTRTLKVRTKHVTQLSHAMQQDLDLLPQYRPETRTLHASTVRHASADEGPGLLRYLLDVPTRPPSARERKRTPTQRQSKLPRRPLTYITYPTLHPNPTTTLTLTRRVRGRVSSHLSIHLSISSTNSHLGADDDSDEDHGRLLHPGLHKAPDGHQRAATSRQHGVAQQHLAVASQSVCRRRRRRRRVEQNRAP